MNDKLEQFLKATKVKDKYESWLEAKIEEEFKQDNGGEWGEHPHVSAALAFKKALEQYRKLKATDPYDYSKEGQDDTNNYRGGDC